MQQLAQAAPRHAPRRLPLSAIRLSIVMAIIVSLAWLTVPIAHAAVQPPSEPPIETHDATDGTNAACTSQPAFKATIVVGPVGSATARFKTWANEIAAAAKAAGMKVCKVYSPYADKQTVRRSAKGAHLFVALTHGNGYPSHRRGTGDGNDATAHGLGLNASRGSSANKYFGADWVRDRLQLAPRAIVILSHMCYTSGNGEDASSNARDNQIPSYAWAVRHVDNFAQGFLASGSYPAGGRPSAVIALQSQRFPTNDPKGNLIETLMTSNKTLDEVFMTRYTHSTAAAHKDAYRPNSGAIGTHDFYVTKRPDGKPLRSRGRIHIDPDLAHPGTASPASWNRNKPNTKWLDSFSGKKKGIANPNGSGVVSMGYTRSIAGDLDLTASAWRAAAGGSSSPAGGASSSARVTVPKVRGMTPAKAKEALTKAGLKVRATNLRVVHAAVAKGRVVNTKPSHLLDGTPRKVARGTTVQLKVSTGP
ncbi:MAG: PASTA domain-containing protein [Chloroflexi bacterium]|nr:PASTA domain-containing protein [Chloroflexota bacterium]